MKKVFIIALVFFLLAGCSVWPQEKDPIELEPQEKYSIDPDRRCAVTGRGKMAETKEGFYFLHEGMLFYADKSDMSLWVPVCMKANCEHDQFSCYSTGINSIWLEDNRLYCATDPSHGEVSEIGLDGSFLKVVYTEPLLDVPPGRAVTDVGRWDSYCMLISYMEADGSWHNSVLQLEKGGSNVLYSAIYPGQEAISFFAYPSNIECSIRGDYLFESRIPLDGSEDPDRENWLERSFDRYYQICEGSIREITIGDDCSFYGAYLDGDSLYHFHPNDGFYYRDLSTGKEAKLADAAYMDSYGFCIDGSLMLEMTMGVPGIDGTGETVQLRYFDGTDWHEPDVPDTWGTNDWFSLIAAGSDRIFFTVRDRDLPADESKTTLCSIMLGEEKIVTCYDFPTSITLVN